MKPKYAAVDTILSELKEHAGSNPLFKATVEYGEQNREVLATVPLTASSHYYWVGGWAQYTLDLLSALPYARNPAEAEVTLLAVFWHHISSAFDLEMSEESPSPAQVQYAETLGIKLTDADSKVSVSWLLDNHLQGRNEDPDRRPLFQYLKRGYRVSASCRAVSELIGSSPKGTELSDMLLSTLSYLGSGHDISYTEPRVPVPAVVVSSVARRLISQSITRIQ